MAIIGTDRRAGPFTGNGVATAFPFAFVIFASSDLDIYEDAGNGWQPLASGFTVALNPDQDAQPGGTVHFAVAPPPGRQLLFISDVPATQPDTLMTQGGFRPQAVSTGFDRLTALAQQLDERADRTIGAALTDGPITNPLPPAADRAGRFLAFDAGGQPVAATGGGGDSGLRVDLADDAGASLVGFRRAGSVKVQTIAARMGLQEVLATDFENVDPTSSTECGDACQNAINKAIQAGFRRIRFPALGSGDGGYVIGRTLISKDDSGVSGEQGQQIALVGDGKDSTVFKPTGDFTGVHIVTSTWSSGNFGVRFADDDPGGRPPTRVGVKFADDLHQVSICEIADITVRNAYRGFVLEMHVGPLGTMWLITLKRLIAQGCSDWGFHLNSKVGSTTLKFDQVHVNSQGAGGKGVYVNNFNDIMGNLALDQCVDDWFEVVNANIVNLDELALESCILNSAAQAGVRLNSNVAILQSLKELVCHYDTGAGNTATVVALQGNVRAARVGGWSEQFTDIISGSKRKVSINNALTYCAIMDRSVLQDEVIHNGYHCNYTFDGDRKALLGIPPAYGGLWKAGDRISNGAPASGQPSAWLYDATTSTWLNEGNL